MCLCATMTSFLWILGTKEVLFQFFIVDDCGKSWPSSIVKKCGVQLLYDGDIDDGASEGENGVDETFASPLLLNFINFFCKCVVS